ncbi:hypothetical protein [Halococcus thailandensis]|uniref:Uncharacterized protein n=1 Tax=Halococcus thailandensis JCM 13552 TaxID=1227457 RepID=M0NFY4_9EURY|nr:hypothetical protein [Halococcus thailandensis]EMA55989.1 hypothetical protein C451_04546 [Halococcus thailandensis JCM 13552]
MSNQPAATVICTNIDRFGADLWSENDRPHHASAVSTEANEQNHAAVASQHVPDERGHREEPR